MAVVVALKYTKGAESPARGLTVYDASGVAPDLSQGTMAFKLGYPGELAVLTTGVSVTGNPQAPNITFNPSPGAFDNVNPGQYTLQIEQTVGTEQRTWKFPFILEHAVQ
jgi:hypothetical protein